MSPAASFRLEPRDGSRLDQVLALDLYTAASRFVQGAFDVEGSLLDAVRWFLSRDQSGFRARTLSWLAHFGPWKYLSQTQRRTAVAERLRRHYDVSNDFYKLFLDQDLVYSCAYFEDPAATLDTAQQAKLRLICRKLDLRPGERFLDIGCGWGSLLIHAARGWNVRATGCTLSRAQVEEARSRAAGLNVEVLDRDYHDLHGPFDKIASVGMFEHVTPRGLRSYFRKVHELLAPGGLFLNHGIVRPEPVEDDPETLFIQRRVFPVGGISHLSAVIAEAELAGFEVLDVENLRPHYARTCEEWVLRLQANHDDCLLVVPESTWRTWVLYLAGSAIHFQRGALEVHQVLLARRGEPSPAHWTRDYLYSDGNCR
ncbi:MAG: cyclopropane-fatty-acyl-phospholipid synthase family protein [Bryobacter sp.]|nr:cyclopropane-fatty-acyl-phospholipid synthase family protein [Bryobacter sp.]